ncbi:MAG: hypothetical protein ACJARD_000044 [Alphaproteobacteria bacterium]|jgi:hypothetical protein
MGNITSQQMSQGTQGTAPPHRARQKLGNILRRKKPQQPLFDLSAMQTTNHSDSLDVIKLPHQKIFKKLQKAVIKELDSIDTEILQNHNILSSISMKVIKPAFNTVNNLQGYTLVERSLSVQFGTTASNDLHTDQGSDSVNSNYDYTVVIPVLDYDISGAGNDNFQPESTVILPQEIKTSKNLYKDSDDNNINRQANFYDQDEVDALSLEGHLVSEPLKKGTAIIVHTATSSGSENEGASVFHKSPATPEGFKRVYVIARLSKNH